MPSHPCLSCGACCAAFRVAFHWSETDAASDGGVDASLTQPLDPHRVAMRGTFAAPIRCIGLRGTVGRDAQCSVYAQRPSRAASCSRHGNAVAHPARNATARAAHGLPALAA